MILFGKEIARTYLIDFFPDTAMIDQLKEFLQQDMIVRVQVPESREQVLEFLDAIEQEIGDEGCLIHLLGHGDEVRQGFGRMGLCFQYNEMVGPLARINSSCGGNLIVNASLMCLTDPFQNLYDQNQDVFHACVYSIEKRSAQTLRQLLHIYRKCRNGLDTRTAIDQENDAIEDTQDPGFRPFGYT